MPRSAPDGRRPAHVTIRRLNRTEYNNTIRDLIGLDLHPADDFPADDIGYGFDNIADVLATPPILVEMEMAAAEAVIDAAFALARGLGSAIMNPPPNTVPLAFRKYTAARPRCRATDKLLRSVATAVDPELVRQQRIYDILRGFADRAFRRPATHDELTRLLTIALSAEKDGEDPEAALRLALQRGARLAAVPLPARAGPRAPDRPRRAISTWPRGSRISSGAACPTTSCSGSRRAGNCAAHGTILRGQVRRMLADPRGRSLSENSTANGFRRGGSRILPPTRPSSPTSTSRSGRR